MPTPPKLSWILKLELFVYQPFLTSEPLSIIEDYDNNFCIEDENLQGILSNESSQRRYFWNFDLFWECVIILTKSCIDQGIPVVCEVKPKSFNKDA